MAFSKTHILQTFQSTEVAIRTAAALLRQTQNPLIQQSELHSQQKILTDRPSGRTVRSVNSVPSSQI